MPHWLTLFLFLVVHCNLLLFSLIFLFLFSFVSSFFFSFFFSLPHSIHDASAQQRATPEPTTDEMARWSPLERRQYETTMTLLAQIEDGGMEQAIALQQRAAPHQCSGCGATLQTKHPKRAGFMSPAVLQQLQEVKRAVRMAKVKAMERELQLLATLVPAEKDPSSVPLTQGMPSSSASIPAPASPSVTSLTSSEPGQTVDPTDSQDQGNIAGLTPSIGAPTQGSGESASYEDLDPDEAAEVAAVERLEALPMLSADDAADGRRSTKKRHIVCNRCHHLVHYR
jgi:hypothetical protein